MERKNLIIAAVVVVALICVTAIAFTNLPMSGGEEQKSPTTPKSWHFWGGFNETLGRDYKEWKTQMIEIEAEEWKIEWKITPMKAWERLCGFNVEFYEDQASTFFEILEYNFEEGWEGPEQGSFEINKSGKFYLIVSAGFIEEWSIEVYYYA